MNLPNRVTVVSVTTTHGACTIDIEYNKRLDHQRPCLEDDLTAGSNLKIEKFSFDFRAEHILKLREPLHFV